MSEDAPSKISYRPEIDGLRAIAVISVVLYHAEYTIASSKLFAGGFIGVDIFFVISGYLIARLLLQEYAVVGRISLKSFYERRARRILPALFLVLGASMVVAPHFLFALDYDEFLKSTLAALFFVANIFFYGVTTAYDAESSLLKPLMHTWSLGVEEQFYLFFPLLLIALSGLGPRMVRAGIILLILASWLSAYWLTSVNPSLNFFITTSRLWELLLGVLVAVYIQQQGAVSFRSYWALHMLALVVIFISVFSMKADYSHPGLPTVLPVMAVTILLIDTPEGSGIIRFLGGRILGYLGKISYSLYLWHFPIFAFARNSNYSIDNFDRTLWIMLSVALASLSYRYIEQPFRNKKLLGGRADGLIMLTVFAALTGWGVYALCDNKGSKASPPVNVAAADPYQKDLDKYPFAQLIEIPANDTGLQIFDGENLREIPYQRPVNGRLCHHRGPCYFDRGGDALRIAFIGDSQMASIARQLSIQLPNANAMFETYAACPAALGIEGLSKGVTGFSMGVTRFCSSRMQQQRFDNVREFQPDIVVLMAAYHKMNNLNPDVQYLNVKGEASSQQGILDAINAFLGEGYQVIQLYPIPESDVDVPKKILAESPRDQQGQIDYLVNHPIYASYADFMSENQQAFDVFDSVDAERYHRVYPHRLFCPEDGSGNCLTHNTENVFYSDDDHPSIAGAKMITELVVNKIAEIVDGETTLTLDRNISR